jgi:hypothetical protein
MADNGLICVLPGVSGSTGDVRPLLALALALRGRGFDIMVCGDAGFEGLAARVGIRPDEWFEGSEVPQAFWLRTAAARREIWRERPRSGDRWVWQELREHWAQRMTRFWRAVGGPDNPRLVAAIGSIPAVRVLRRFGPQCARVRPHDGRAHSRLAPPPRHGAAAARLHPRAVPSRERQSGDFAAA